jgi:hypothetical protein
MVQIPAGSILVESIQAAAAVGAVAVEAAGGWLHIASKGRKAAAKSEFFIQQERKNNLSAKLE